MGKPFIEKKIQDCTPEEQEAIIFGVLNPLKIVAPQQHDLYRDKPYKCVLVTEVLELLEVHEYIDEPEAYKTIHRVVYRNQPWLKLSR
jgi:hypothetical protein